MESFNESKQASGYGVVWQKLRMELEDRLELKEVVDEEEVSKPEVEEKKMVMKRKKGASPTKLVKADIRNRGFCWRRGISTRNFCKVISPEDLAIYLAAEEAEGRNEASPLKKGKDFLPAQSKTTKKRKQQEAASFIPTLSKNRKMNPFVRPCLGFHDALSSDPVSVCRKGAKKFVRQRG
ncbi:hypothetical protein COLO4_21189 [Corchorus olitorius]|uniref:Uncharacterized protein n=1 Tax=Corchorus olitorius TaxID=93759 RepID=A0A1R3IV56_9ROSI|nr:hypothetical protein COLO4_21189 [Corchorus olitorius]